MRYRLRSYLRLEHFADVVYKTRGFFLIFGLIAATGSILAWMPQGQDLVRTVTDVNSDHSSGFTWQIFWLCFSVAVLGFQGWFWARVIAEQHFGKREEWVYGTYLTWIPRLLGLLPFALLFIALWRVQEPNAWPAWILAGLGVAFLVLLWTRTAAVRGIQRTAERLAQLGRPRAAVAISSSLHNLKPFIFWGGIIYAIAALLIVTVDPVTLSVHFGPAAVVLTACALLIPVLTTLSLVGSAFHIRVTEALFLLVVLFSLWVDNHEIRHAASEPVKQASAIAVRPTVEVAYGKWRSQFPNPSPVPIPIIFVASEGGASRAGYWTGAVMSRLETATYGEFSRHIFAISSISGGSLGVGGFLASIHDKQTQAAVTGGTTTLAGAVSNFVGRDYLSPALAGGLFPDFLQRFIPISLFPDRSAALERGWEAGWKSRCNNIACDHPDRMERDFLSLWSDDDSGRWLPAWLIGGALEEDGRPILTSNIYFGDHIDAWDFHNVARRDVRLSTAILNGARFPLVSSSGTIVDPALPQKNKAVHIIDGGYFDAAGVETIRGRARAMFGRNGVAENGDVLPVFLLLSNDGVNPPFASAEKVSQLSMSAPVACRGRTVKSGCPGDAGLSSVAPDLFGPVQGLFRSRGAHGERLKTLLYLDPPTRSEQASIVLTLDLCSLAVPMNWSLSQNAKRIVDELLDKRIPRDPESCEGRNDKDFDTIVTLLKR
ncbi:hypothetical protein ACCT18_05190 [Rhizobium ruizarguesonis]